MNNEIEHDRKEALTKLSEDGINIDNFANGTHGCHEALHTTHVLLQTFDEHILNHPAVIFNSEWYSRAYEIQKQLHELYQDIGANHL